MPKEIFAENDKYIIYSIYSKNNDYYGNLIVRREKSTTPEIGIDLIESMRNNGIAGRCIRLFADRFFQEHNNIDFLLFRVSSFNLQSIRMIEKLGAEKFEEFLTANPSRFLTYHSLIYWYHFLSPTFPIHPEKPSA